MKIVLTGTPGTGKSEVAKELSKILGLQIVDVKEIVNKKRIYSIEGKEKEVDPDRLSIELVKETRNKKDFIIENHLLCEFPIDGDYVFVLRTKPKILEKRLVKRRYSKEKIMENMIAEILDYCLIAVEQNYKTKPIQIDTSKLTAKQAAKKIALAIRHKKINVDTVNYSDDLKHYLRLK